MNSVSDFLKRAAERNGFNRDRFEERRVPNDFSNVCILPFFGDFKTAFVLSSFLLSRYRREVKSSKYFILASWPGLQSMFPFVDEYWSLNDFAQIKRFYEASDGFFNKSDLGTTFTRNINEFFRDVIETRDIAEFYDNGLTSKFFNKFNNNNIERFIPFVASSALLGRDFVKDLSIYPGYKVFLHPSFFFTRWNQGKSQNVFLKVEFWKELISFLLNNKCTPVIWQNYLSYDLSNDFEDRCIFFKENDISKVFAAIRATGLCLNVFNYMSYFSLISRCPYISVDERPRYFFQKEYELEDLYPDIPKDHIFTFSTILMNGTASNWKNDLFKIILTNIEKTVSELDRDLLPSTGESLEIVSYSKVREFKLKKLGTKLLQVPKE
jgi:hypothetical protein